MSPSALEMHYSRLIEASGHAERWATARDEALARGDRSEAERCLTRYWMAVHRARRHLSHAWQGLEMFARRELSTRMRQPNPDGAQAAIDAVRLRLSSSLPSVSGVPGLYGHIRRLVRQEARAYG